GAGCGTPYSGVILGAGNVIQDSVTGCDDLLGGPAPSLEAKVSAAAIDLGPLLLNAPGLTATMALGSDSVALGAAVADICPETDQRGEPRPAGNCASGAYQAVRVTLGLSVTRSGSGSGTVTSSPEGIDCGSTCTAEFATGSTVTLTATPAAGSTFTGWSGACSGTGTCEVTMSEARSVDAAFTADPPSLKASVGTAKKVRAGKTAKVGLRVTNRATSQSAAESLRSCLTLPRTLLFVSAGKGKVNGRTACWNRSSLAIGSSVTFKARVRALKSAASTRASATLRATVTASGQSGGSASASGRTAIRILPARVPRPQPPTG
ncbi:MAG: choice-of-anchor Q domain-containing protein, partial [Ilumatobacteraceae bacterium]